jgi:hypothetical protein
MKYVSHTRLHEISSKMFQDAINCCLNSYDVQSTKCVEHQRGSAMGFELVVLPPTSSAARQHSFKMYLQVQQWMEMTCRQQIGVGEARVTDCSH